MSLREAPPRDTSETPSSREKIRSHMKMVIDQLEGILQELKEVASELREVVAQIDELTSDFDFDLEPDDWTGATVSSTSSSERGLGDTFRLDLLNPDVLSDSWELCSFLEASTGPTLKLAEPQPGHKKPEPDVGDNSTAVPTNNSVYLQMNGGLPIPNGPLRITPDSSSEEASSSTHSHKASRPSRLKERVRFSDKILYHALCCDDDEGKEEERGEDAIPETDSEPSPPTVSPTLTPTILSPSEHSLHLNCLDSSSLSPPALAGGVQTFVVPPAPARKGHINPSCRKKLLRNNSTQTVSDKSTQTVLPYIPNKQKTMELH
ncbi:inhibitory synaptic factor 1-like [Paramormyrops kingsleyae]|uniref:inhibitory synaptic factor 1-like n=1 Tax=Paramormyrops kingsleyae TaxID=1676925 RepID=UPI003B971265